MANRQSQSMRFNTSVIQAEQAKGIHLLTDEQSGGGSAADGKASCPSASTSTEAEQGAESKASRASGKFLFSTTV